MSNYVKRRIVQKGQIITSLEGYIEHQVFDGIKYVSTTSNQGGSILGSSKKRITFNNLVLVIQENK